MKAYKFTSDLSGWDLSKVTTTRSMFQYAQAFHSDVSGWDVSMVKSMENLFSKFGGCATYATFDADISAWDGKRICISSRPAARKFSACLFLIFHRAVFLSHNFCNPNHP